MINKFKKNYNNLTKERERVKRMGIRYRVKDLKKKILELT